MRVWEVEVFAKGESTIHQKPTDIHSYLDHSSSHPLTPRTPYQTANFSVFKEYDFVTRSKEMTLFV